MFKSVAEKVTFVKFDVGVCGVIILRVSKLCVGSTNFGKRYIYIVLEISITFKGENLEVAVDKNDSQSSNLVSISHSNRPTLDDFATIIMVDAISSCGKSSNANTLVGCKSQSLGNLERMARCIEELERIYGIRKGSANDKGVNQYFGDTDNLNHKKTQIENQIKIILI